MRISPRYTINEFPHSNAVVLVYFLALMGDSSNHQIRPQQMILISDKGEVGSEWESEGEEGNE